MQSSLLYLILSISLPYCLCQSRAERINISQKITSLVEIEKLKNRILRELKSTRILIAEEKDASGRQEFITNPVTEQRPSSFKIWSEAKDANKLSGIRFDMSSLVRHNVTGFATITLMVSLRPERKGRRKKINSTLSASEQAAKTTLSHLTKKRRKEIKETLASKLQTYHINTNNTVNGLHETINTPMVNTKTRKSASATRSNKSLRRSAKRSKKEKRNRKKKSRKNRRNRRRKDRKIKIVVRHIDPITSKKTRVAMPRVTFSKRTVVPIQLPLTLLQSEAFSSNKTLILFVSCKRCGHKVHLERVYRKRKQARKKGRSLNPNRPYVVITNRILLNRQERHAVLPRHISLSGISKNVVHKNNLDAIESAEKTLNKFV